MSAQEHPNQVVEEAPSQRRRRRAAMIADQQAACFGGAIGLISCYKGFSCAPGAAGVGRAATSAFVASFVAIVAINLLLVEFMNALTVWIYGGLPRVL